MHHFGLNPRNSRSKRIISAKHRTECSTVKFRFVRAFKIAMDQGKAITETSFPTLRKKADAMAQNIINAVAEAAERGERDG